MAFPEKEATEVLAQCHRRCCICHRFCGFKMELDHIVPKAEGGLETLDNAIPVCFECHAEIHAYNDKHPRGRKYRPDELRKHKEQWLEICRTSASVLASVPPRTDVGPIQALIDELEFNKTIAAHADEVLRLESSAHFAMTQFERCITEGILSLLEPNLKADIMETYGALKRANTQVDIIPSALARGGGAAADAVNRTRDRLREAQPLIAKALDRLDAVLRGET